MVLKACKRPDIRTVDVIVVICGRLSQTRKVRTKKSPVDIACTWEVSATSFWTNTELMTEICRAKTGEDVLLIQRIKYPSRE